MHGTNVYHTEIIQKLHMSKMNVLGIYTIRRPGPLLSKNFNFSISQMALPIKTMYLPSYNLSIPKFALFQILKHSEVFVHSVRVLLKP